MKYIQFLTLTLMILSGCAHEKEKKKAPPSQVPTVTEAYEFGFPLVLMDLTRETMTNVASPTPEKAPINQFTRMKTVNFPDASYHDVVRPNVDTFYASAWLDLSRGPMILEVPDSNQRYFLAPMLDGWTNVFKSPGKRTTGTTRRRFLVVPPNWQGEAPIGVPLVQSPTNLTWIIGRVQVNGAGDAKEALKVQQGFKIIPFASYGKKYTPAKGEVNANSNFVPSERIFSMTTEEFFTRLNRLMVENPPSIEDKLAMDRFAAIGVGPGKSFDMSKFSDVDRMALENLSLNMKAKFEADKKTMTAPVNGWMVVRGLGQYGTDYHKRALVAFSGLGANLDADAMYPTLVMDSLGQPLSGDKHYVIHFTKEQIPAVNAFWSFTVYGADNYLVQNPIDRFAIGSRDELNFNEDGSLDIYLGPTTPGGRREANWLPTPRSGSFDVTARLYWPEEKVLNPSWSLPPAVPINPQNLSQAK